MTISVRVAHAIVAAVGATVVLGAAPRLSTAVEQGPPARASVLREIAGEESFRKVFDRAATAPRLVLLLSPT